MWLPLSEFSESDFQHVADLVSDGGTKELADTLRILASRLYVHQLFVVTAMGRLRLTTARTWSEDRHHWRYPSIALTLSPERNILVMYDPGGDPSSKPTASQILKSPGEAAEYIDILMNRISYDTENVRAALDAARERKANQWE